MWYRGPEQYDLAKTVLWLHPGQKKGGQVSTGIIYDEQRDVGYLSRCLNLQDAKAIQEKGIETFRKFFKGKSLLLWKAVVKPPGGQMLAVPCLSEHCGALLIDWIYFEFALEGNAITLHLPTR
jgi:hypothetical protein